jgi:hypothetical protein
MRFLKPSTNLDQDRLTRTCALWFKDELKLRIVEYGLGNSFTGRIDMLATDGSKVYLITINSSRFEDALLQSLMGFRWFHENIDFLSRVYGPEEIDMSLQPVIVILSPDFPHEALSVLSHTLRLPVRLFKYLLFDSADETDLYVEELLPPDDPARHPAVDPESLRKELSIEKADLTDDEIREFIAAIRG